jgi:hypothetical protein
MFIQINRHTTGEHETVIIGLVELNDDDVGEFYIQLDNEHREAAQIVITIAGYEDGESYDVGFIAELVDGIPRLDQVQVLKFKAEEKPVAVDFDDDAVVQMARLVAREIAVENHMNLHYAAKIGVKSSYFH